MERYTSMKNIRIKKNNDKGDVTSRELRHKSSKGTRSDKKIINVDALLREGGKRKSEV